MVTMKFWKATTGGSWARMRRWRIEPIGRWILEKEMHKSYMIHHTSNFICWFVRSEPLINQSPCLPAKLCCSGERVMTNQHYGSFKRVLLTSQSFLYWDCVDAWKGKCCYGIVEKVTPKSKRIVQRLLEPLEIRCLIFCTLLYSLSLSSQGVAVERCSPLDDGSCWW